MCVPPVFMMFCHFHLPLAVQTQKCMTPHAFASMLCMMNAES